MTSKYARSFKSIIQAIGNEVKSSFLVYNGLEKNDVEIWESVKALFVYLGIYLFFLGWAFTRFYFQNFDVGSYNVKIDFFNYYIYGFESLQQSWFLVGQILLLFAFLTMWWLIRKKRWLICTSVYSIILFPAAFGTIKSDVDKQISSILLQEKEAGQQIPVYLAFKDSFSFEVLHHAKLKSNVIDSFNIKDSGFFSRLIQGMDDGHVYQVYEDDNQLFLYYNTNLEKNDFENNIYLFRIEKSNIIYRHSLINQQRLKKIK